MKKSIYFSLAILLLLLFSCDRNKYYNDIFDNGMFDTFIISSNKTILNVSIEYEYIIRHNSKKLSEDLLNQIKTTLESVIDTKIKIMSTDNEEFIYFEDYCLTGVHTDKSIEVKKELIEQINKFSDPTKLFEEELLELHVRSTEGTPQNRLE